MTIPSTKDLVMAACHFGHPKQKWHPGMKSFIYGTRKGIHIFDIEQTHAHLTDVVTELKKLQETGKDILFVSTKQQSTAFIEELCESLKQPHVTKKWIPGLLTNWNTLKQRIKYYKELKEGFATGSIEKYTKKEQTALRKQMMKLETALSGVAEMKGAPAAVFVIDGVRDNVAVKEANRLKIPVYGICDTNCDPSEFTNFIPANDDAVSSIALILNTIKQNLINK